MGLMLPPIEAYQVQHLPIVKAYADKIGLVEAINAVVPTEMGVDPGTIVLGMILDTLSGRSPLYRLEEFFTHQDTRSEEHTSELQSLRHLVCRLLLEKKKQ